MGGDKKRNAEEAQGLKNGETEVEQNNWERGIGVSEMPDPRG